MIKESIFMRINKTKYHIVMLILTLVFSCKNTREEKFNIDDFEYERVVKQADAYLNDNPVTITSYICERSKGGKNDFYSEGDYWWPNPDDLDGPYIRKDGLSNPENFVDHRIAMRSMGLKVSSLVAAYKLTREKKYGNQAVRHLKAWFIDEATMMNPNLLYSQAIKGVCDGRYIGIIDSIHLIEVAKAIQVLNDLQFLEASNFKKLTAWFSKFTEWLTNSKFGIGERDHGNNHSAWWTAQVASYSHLIGNKENLEFCRNFYKEVILPEQMDSQGRFTDELTRTRPYAYSLFNLEAFTLMCKILSVPEDNLWEYKTANNQSTQVALQFMYPYIKDKSQWPYPPDVQHFDALPVRGSALLFGSVAYQNNNYLNLWKALTSDITEQEVLRTFVIKQPVLWMNN